MLLLFFIKLSHLPPLSAVLKLSTANLPSGIILGLPPWMGNAFPLYTHGPVCFQQSGQRVTRQWFAGECLPTKWGVDKGEIPQCVAFAYVLVVKTFFKADFLEVDYQHYIKRRDEHNSSPEAVADPSAPGRALGEVL